jgi:hypothetical protein
MDDGDRLRCHDHGLKNLNCGSNANGHQYRRSRRQLDRKASGFLEPSLKISPQEAPMSSASIFRSLASCLALVALISIGHDAAAADLLTDGDFEACPNGAALRRDDKGQDWYESRKDTKQGRTLLKLSTKDIGGNSTRKAMIKADPKFNTYLTQRLGSPQTGRFTVQFDIYVREILPTDNRSAFCFIGASKDKKAGPNSTGIERFVFLGFENGTAPGLINLFARQGKSAWKDKTILAKGLELGKWYTLALDVDPAGGTYSVKIVGLGDWIPVQAFGAKGKAPKKLTHLSFASWNDGAGTFYVDNVEAHAP